MKTVNNTTAQESKQEQLRAELPAGYLAYTSSEVQCPSGWLLSVSQHPEKLHEIIEQALFLYDLRYTHAGQECYATGALLFGKEGALHIYHYDTKRSIFLDVKAPGALQAGLDWLITVHTISLEAKENYEKLKLLEKALPHFTHAALTF